ncbi:hypothetical protein BMF94_0996 [Rhodotorula taiwanensis]|uniref:Uncharacterized protein n=1 Tax=Rhodotorula taiwanensis TaxID=741276 RepID=A0A2S5BGP1_9BASI|nr:hypothetical protein BMF94_0996 [Rhodotorula taiwanensis]
MVGKISAGEAAVDLVLPTIHHRVHYGPSIAALGDRPFKEDQTWEHTRRLVNKALKAAGPLPDGTQVTFDDLCPEPSRTSQSSSNLNGLRLLREYGELFDPLHPAFEPARLKSRTGDLGNRSAPVLPPTDDAGASAQVLASRIQHAVAQSPKHLTWIDKVDALDATPIYVSQPTPPGFPDIGTSGQPGVSRFRLVLPKSLRENGKWRVIVVRLWLSPGGREKMPFVHLLQQATLPMPPHRRRAFDETTKLYDPAKLSQPIADNLYHALIERLLFQPRPAPSVLRDILVRCGIRLDVAATPNQTILQRLGAEFQVFSPAVEIRLVPQGKKVVVGGKGKPVRAASEPGWTPFAEQRSGKTHDMLEWRLTEGKGVPIKAEIEQRRAQDPSYRYKPVPLAQNLRGSKLLRVSEDVTSHGYSERRIALYCGTDVQREEELAEEVEAIREKKLGCCISACPFNWKSQTPTGDEIPLGAHPDIAHSPFAPGEDEKALCPPHHDLARLVFEVWKASEDDFLADLANIKPFYGDGSLTIVDQYAQFYRCNLGCGRQYGRNREQLKLLPGLPGCPSGTRTGAPSTDSGLADIFHPYSLGTCLACYHRVTKPLLEDYIEQNMRRLDKGKVKSRKDLPALPLPEFYRPRQYTCEVCLKKRKKRVSRIAGTAVELIDASGRTVCDACLRLQIDVPGNVWLTAHLSVEGFDRKVLDPAIQAFLSDPCDQTICEIATSMRSPVAGHPVHPSAFWALLNDTDFLKTFCSGAVFEKVHDIVDALRNGPDFTGDAHDANEDDGEHEHDYEEQDNDGNDSHDEQRNYNEERNDSAASLGGKRRSEIISSQSQSTQRSRALALAEQLVDLPLPGKGKGKAREVDTAALADNIISEVSKRQGGSGPRSTEGLSDSPKPIDGEGPLAPGSSKGDGPRAKPSTESRRSPPRPAAVINLPRSGPDVEMSDESVQPSSKRKKVPLDLDTDTSSPPPSAQGRRKRLRHSTAAYISSASEADTVTGSVPLMSGGTSSEQASRPVGKAKRRSNAMPARSRGRRGGKRKKKSGGNLAGFAVSTDDEDEEEAARTTQLSSDDELMSTSSREPVAVGSEGSENSGSARGARATRSTRARVNYSEARSPEPSDFEPADAPSRKSKQLTQGSVSSDGDDEDAYDDGDDDDAGDSEDD